VLLEITYMDIVVKNHYTKVHITNDAENQSNPLSYHFLYYRNSNEPSKTMEEHSNNEFSHCTYLRRSSRIRKRKMDRITENEVVESVPNEPVRSCV